jgi:hypothetical protein
MEKINSKKFSQTLEKLKKLFPKAKKIFGSATILYDCEGGKDKNGSLELHALINGVSARLTSVSSSTPIKADHYDHYALGFAQSLFLLAVTEKASVQLISEMFHREISNAFRDCDIEHFKKYHVVSFYDLSIEPNNSIFSFIGEINYIVFLENNSTKNSVDYEFKHAGYIQYFEKYSKDPNIHSIASIIGMFEVNPNFYNGLEFYSKSLVADYESVLQALDLLSQGEGSYSFQLKKKIINTDISNGAKFESVMEEFLSYVFQDYFDEFEIKTQVPNKGRLRIRDFIIVNTSPNLKFLEHLRESGTNHLLFDAKNYQNELKTPDLDTFFNYISENDHFGKIGFILSRKGISNNLHELIIRKMMRREAEVIVLDQDDIIEMINIKASARNPVRYLEEKLSALRMKM